MTYEQIADLFQKATSVQLHCGVDDSGAYDIEYLSWTEMEMIVEALRGAQALNNLNKVGA